MESTVLGELLSRISAQTAKQVMIEKIRAAERGSSVDESVEQFNIVLLDYETNADIDDLSRPLSHASLIKQYLEGTWPCADASR